MQIEQYARVYAEVDLDALHYNMEQMRQKISPDTRIMGIIKADGYGHGAVSLGRELNRLIMYSAMVSLRRKKRLFYGKQD